MRKLSIIISAIVTIILALIMLPPFVFYLLGCYQLGSWIGSYVYKLLDDSEQEQL